MQNRQPQDEWTFLRPDEFTDDQEVERIDERSERGPEETAMHIERLTRPVTDPAKTDVDVGAGSDDVPITYFDDEQPESANGREARDDDHEPDLEELLESQHYAFGSSDS